MPIVIDFVSNVRNFLKGTDDAEAALDDVAGSLDDLARDGDRAGRKIEDALDGTGDAFSDVAKEGDRAGDKLEKSLDQSGDSIDELNRKFRELATETRDSTRDAADAQGRNAKRGADEASEAAQEVKDEFKSNLSEITSSFNGSMESVGDLVQGTLGGLVGGLGPLGAAIGAAGAVGVGLIIAETVKAEERATALRERVSEVTDELIEAGSTGRRSGEQIVSRLREIATEADKDAINLSKIREQAERLNTPFATLAGAYAGVSTNLDPLIEKTSEALRAERQYREEITGSSGLVPAAVQERIDALEKQAVALGELKQVQDQAREAERLYVESGAAAMEEKAEATAGFTESVQSALQEAGTAWDDLAEKEGGTSLEEYNAHVEEKIAAIQRYQENVGVVAQRLNQDALNYILSLGEEAAPLLQAFVDAPLDQQERTAENWATLGAAASAKYKTELETGLDAEIAGPRVAPVIVDLEGSMTKFQQFYSQRNIELPVTPVPRSGRPVT